MKKSALISRVIAVSAAIMIISYIIITNTAPFTITRAYTSNDKNTLVLTPKNRIENIDGASKQIDDLIYFNSKMPFHFNQANIKVSFKNPSTDQKILLGYKDQDVWHYNTQVLDDPLLDSLNWAKTGNGPYLYQKNVTFNTVNDFLNNPPENKIVGVKDYKNSEFLQPDTKLPGYKPSGTNTTIDTPLRGKTIMYAYLNHEPFDMSFTKKDLNRQRDPDTVKISIYKGQDSVFTDTIDDDGNTSDNHKTGQLQTTEIKNPGPGLPEPGVYKILIDASNDSLITKINTNLHKIAFEGPLYVANNFEVYGGAVEKTQQTALTTNAQSINFRSDHGQSPFVTVGQQTINITTPNQVFTASNTASTVTVLIPKSDMIVNSTGYFSFTPDQFFAPTPYKILPINSASDVLQADYILTNYPGAPKHEGDWLIAERELNLSDAIIQKGELSWLINAPGLRQNNRSVEYKQIEMTLIKKGWLKQ